MTPDIDPDTEMKDAVLAYLRNINTRPGANAGRSIDPSKPGPDDAPPVGWFCQPTDSGKPTPRKWLLRFDDADCGDCYFDDEKEAYAAFERANIAYSCYLFATVPTRTSEAPWVSTAPPRHDANQNNVLGGPLDPTVVASLPWEKRQAPIEVPSPVRLVAQSEPRPDASGLIEAAEWLEQTTFTGDRRFYYREAAIALRARAADRSAHD